MKRKYKVIVLFLTLSIMCMCRNMIIYASDEQGDTKSGLFEYVDTDGTIFSYYLDENGNPYIITDTEIIYLLIPLEHLKVTDADLIDELNREMAFDRNARSFPSSYYDISDGDSTEAEKINSSVYSTPIDFTSTPVFTTPVLKVNRQHTTLRVKTTDIKKENVFAGNKINFTIYYFDTTSEQWMAEEHNDLNCTGTNGVGYIFAPSVYQFVKFDVSKSSKIKSLIMNVWTSGIW